MTSEEPYRVLIRDFVRVAKKVDESDVDVYLRPHRFVDNGTYALEEWYFPISIPS
ncbi:MAG: hypothetical protein QXO75_09990 [Nitrososphaerota archaeon]